MPTEFKSPFATSFNNAVKRGTPCSVAIEKIASRNNKTTKTVCESLFKAGLVWRQKMNGQWIYFPCEGVKGTATNAKVCQFQMWQNFIDWCIISGCCTPEQIKKCCGSQNAFMSNCKKYFTKQVNGTWNKTKTTKTTGRKRTTTSTAKRRSTTTKSKSYKFSTSRRGTTTRKYRRAA